MGNRSQHIHLEYNCNEEGVGGKKYYNIYYNILPHITIVLYHDIVLRYITIPYQRTVIRV